MKISRGVVSSGSLKRELNKSSDLSEKRRNAGACNISDFIYFF
jgi:hypothetical protein